MATALSYAQRNLLARQPALAALAPGDLIYTPGPPQFSALVASILGNAGTPADGFEGIMGTILSTLDGDIKAIDALGALLKTIGIVDGALDATIFAPIAAQYAAFAKAGDLQLGEQGTTTAPPPPPPNKCKDPTLCTKGGNPPGGPLCKRRFPKGYDEDDPGAGDPCTP